MTQVSGQRTSYSGGAYSVNPLIPGKRAIADLIDLIDPYEVPMLRYLGISESGAGGMSKAQQFRLVNWPSTMVQWLEDDLQPLTTTLGATLAATNATATVATTLGNANYVRPGDVLLVDDERLLINAASSDSVTLTRMYGGTDTSVNTSASHASTTTVRIIGRARDEGDESDSDFTTQIADAYNYTQIFQAEVKVSRTQTKLQNYGMSAEYDMQVLKKYREQLRLLESSIFYGRRYAGSATANNGRMFGGLKQFITNNTAALSGAPLLQKDLEDRIQAVWEDGGMPDLLVCGAWAKRKINSWYAPYVRTQRTETTGGMLIEQVETDFGTLNILLDRWCPTNELFILTSEKIGVIPFDEFFDEPLAKTGDYERGQLVGEYTLVVKNDKAHGFISGFSTTS